MHMVAARCKAASQGARVRLASVVSNAKFFRLTAKCRIRSSMIAAAIATEAGRNADSRPQSYRR